MESSWVQIFMQFFRFLKDLLNEELRPDQAPPNASKLSKAQNFIRPKGFSTSSTCRPKSMAPALFSCCQAYGHLCLLLCNTTWNKACPNCLSNSGVIKNVTKQQSKTTLEGQADLCSKTSQSNFNFWPGPNILSKLNVQLNSS